MTEKTLFVEIFQPFAQYRNPFTFYYAQTYPLPPKSTVIGMLQNATDRYYDPEFWNLKINTHGGFESVFWNYQQLIKGDVEFDKTFRVVNQGKPLYNEGVKSQRAPVHQQELFNGRIYLFIRGEEGLLDEIRSSLEKPKKILSLGRSEDVVYIRNVSEVELKQKEAKKSIWLTYPTYIRKEIQCNNEREEFPIKNQKYPVYSIPVYVVFKNNGVPVKNKAEITKTTEREVKFETVIYTGFDYVIKLSEPVKFEEIEIDGKKFRIVSEFGWL
ncbi:MAG: CRISPR-associated protein Cas5t [Archaeoglobi archaeon]|nr:CRISPR-associated protein Cas5t [Archaeoglobi archaeon]